MLSMGPTWIAKCFEQYKEHGLVKYVKNFPWGQFEYRDLLDKQINTRSESL